MAHALNQVIRDVTLNYLDSIDVDNPPTPAIIQADILENLHTAFEIENANKNKGEKWAYMTKLIPAQIADILLRLYNIVNIACAGINADREYDILAMYQTEGDNKGIYIDSEHVFYLLAHYKKRCARSYQPN